MIEIHKEVLELATTKKQINIAKRLERTVSVLFYNYQEFLRIEGKKEPSEVDKIQKKRLINIIAKLIEKL
jgi:hypothetical protein